MAGAYWGLPEREKKNVISKSTRGGSAVRSDFVIACGIGVGTRNMVFDWGKGRTTWRYFLKGTESTMFKGFGTHGGRDRLARLPRDSPKGYVGRCIPVVGNIFLAHPMTGKELEIKKGAGRIRPGYDAGGKAYGGIWKDPGAELFYTMGWALGWIWDLWDE